MKRVFLIVIDSFGIGYMPDACDYGDEGSNTFKACFDTGKLNVGNMRELGLFNIDGVNFGTACNYPKGSFARMREISKGKDTITGHWEIAGLSLNYAMPTFPDGFAKEIIDKFKDLTGREVLCNKPYSGTQVIKDYGKESIEKGALIVYTSADSVFQIAAHEDIVPLDLLYEYCKMARNILTGKYAVGRVIARPFNGQYPNFNRTSGRHDFSLIPPKSTMLDLLTHGGLEVIAVGKINDIFAGRGITQKVHTANNHEGICRTLEFMQQDFEGLCFINLVDFDMLYGHRNNAIGYAESLSDFDKSLKSMMNLMKQDDILIITADHGCDPSTASTDHSREYTPMLIYGKNVKSGINLHTRSTFSDISASILDYFGVDNTLEGTSFFKEIVNA